MLQTFNLKKIQLKLYLQMLKLVMSQAEQIYNARQLADELEITLQMLSIYAKAYTQMTKQQIGKKGRLGRHFTEAQRQVIKNAREMVQQNTGVTVEEAMRKALLFDADALEPRLQIEGATIDLERLKQALSEAVTAPLLSELQSIRGELEVMRHENKELRGKNLRPVEELAAVEDKHHGPLVKFSIWLESLLRR